MAYFNKKYDVDANDGKELLYDLRQIYAKVIGRILDRLELNRKLNMYSEWYEDIRCLYVEINKNLPEKERQEFKDELTKTNKVICENELAYQRKINDANQNRLIWDALADLEMYVKDLMEKHNMFGYAEDDLGL